MCERDVGDRLIGRRQRDRCMAQPRAHQVLMRRDARDGTEDTQEVIRAHVHRAGDRTEAQRFGMAGFDQTERADDAPFVARARHRGRRIHGGRQRVAGNAQRKLFPSAGIGAPAFGFDLRRKAIAPGVAATRWVWKRACRAPVTPAATRSK